MIWYRSFLLTISKNLEKTMEKVWEVQHLNILLDQRICKMAPTMTVGLGSIWLYVFLALMIGNCGIYITLIKKFSLSTACQQWKYPGSLENGIFRITVVLTGVWVGSRCFVIDQCCRHLGGVPIKKDPLRNI